jgi:hypothetical protein
MTATPRTLIERTTEDNDMKQVITILAALLLLGGCVAVPAQQASRGIQGELSGDIRIGEDLEVVGDASVGDALTVTGATDIGGTLNYGASNLYAIGHASSGKAIVSGIGTTAGNGVYTVTHGLTSIDAVMVSLCQKATAAALIPMAIITSTTVTIHASDVAVSGFVNGAAICYTVIGTK